MGDRLVAKDRQRRAEGRGRPVGMTLRRSGCAYLMPLMIMRAWVGAVVTDTPSDAV